MRKNKLLSILILLTIVSFAISGCSTDFSASSFQDTDIILTRDIDDALKEDILLKNNDDELDETADNEGNSTIVDETLDIVEIIGEVVEIDNNEILVICDTDGNVYELSMPANLSDEEKSQFGIGTVLKISYNNAQKNTNEEMDINVSILTGDEANEIRAILEEKGYVTVEFDYDEVLAYYEEMYADMDGIKYSPKELADATQEAWNTENDSDEWARVSEMENANLEGWIEYMWTSLDPDNQNSSSTDNSSYANSGTTTQEEFTYVNNITIDGIVQLTNEYRVSQGVAEVSVDEVLQQAAQIRADELASIGNIKVNGVAHVRLDGSSWTTVLDELGWAKGSKVRLYAENLASANISANVPAESSTIVNLWINSEPHRQSMINSDYTRIGVGIAWSGNKVIAVQIFGYAS